VTRYQRMLRPWVTGEMDYVISISPELVTTPVRKRGASTGGSTSRADCEHSG